MLLLVAVHAAAAIVAPSLVNRLGRRAFFLLALPPAAAAAWALTMTGPALSGDTPVERTEWVPALGMELSFRLDPLSWILCLVVGAVGALVLAYCAAYFEEDEPALGRFAGCLVAFAGAMLGLVTSDDLLVLYLFWEATTVLSYLLIGHRPESKSSRSAATQALVVTTFGGLAMLVGFIVLAEQGGTYQVSQLLAEPPPATGLTSAAAVLILLGALSKSALVPFHFWLPGAMAAPTPVSAYLHAAAMVKAGIYLVARFAPAFAENPLWRWTVLVLGGATMILGAYRSLRQHDLKQLLAYGTVSQLGFLVVLTGTGTADAALAGLTMLLAHALYKACLFLTVGVIDHATGTRDLRKLSGLRHEMPVLFWSATLAAASMAGLPPLLGFVGKEAAYDAYLGTGTSWGPWVLAVLVLGSALTFAYSVRFVRGAFRDDPDLGPTPVHASGPVLVGVPALLSALGLLAGPLSGSIEPALRAYADAVGSAAADVHLGLWHGLNLALGLSVLTWLLGGVLAAGAAAVERAQAQAPGVPSAEGGYRVIMRSLDRSSLEVTGALQRGSLPLSLGLIVTVFLVLGGGALLLFTEPFDASYRIADSLPQMFVGALIAVAAVAAVRAHRRLRAVFLAGVTGYGVAFLFLLHGAPDLALTQILVETVSIIVFVLVLRRLSGRFDDDPSQANRLVRAAFGIAVGLVAAGLVLVIPNARTAPPASTGMAQQAVDYGGGDNIVNVILVDIRAWDTMGELSVVLAAATGIASLIFLREDNVAAARQHLAEIIARRRSMLALPRESGAKTRWLAEQGALAPARRSVMLEVVARLIFHVVVAWSVYLLFAGHNSPGGGFAAGLVAGLAITVRYLAGGQAELRATAPVMPGVLLGTGLFLSAGVGLVAMTVGGSVLQSWIFDVPIPLVGEVHVVTSVVFDIGVYLVVIGLMLDILRSLGSAIDRLVEIGPDDHADVSLGAAEEEGARR